MAFELTGLRLAETSLIPNTRVLVLSRTSSLFVTLDDKEIFGDWEA
ncbi:MAG: hypothetical protein ACE5KZ_16365 [Candidatus Scalinduaceae bacterium]